MGKRPDIIGIAGPSCSGKTALAARLAETLPGDGVLVLPVDCYYRDLSSLEAPARQRWNFDVPDALERDLLVAHLRALRQGEAVDRPVYDFSTHTRRSESERVCPGDFLIVEGLFALYWDDARDLMDTKVFVAAEDGTCLGRREQRDVRERGRTPESVREQYAQTVRPMYEQYCRPTMPFADLIVNGEDPLDDLLDKVAAYVLRRHKMAP